MSKIPQRSVRRSRAKMKTSKQSARNTLPAGKSKLDAMVSALRTGKGATISDLMELTGWQAHSVRGALSGSLKKARGLTIGSTKSGSERVYRIETGK